MNEIQRKKLKKMKSLMRLTKRNNKKLLENGLNGIESKYQAKNKQPLTEKKNDREISFENKENENEKSCMSKLIPDSTSTPSDAEQIPDFDLINKILPKELIIRVFSYLDVNSLCRCACVSKYWNTLALDGSNWQYVDFFNFQTDVSSCVVENLAKRCHEFLKAIRLENCRWIKDASIRKLFSTCKNIEFLNLKQCSKLTDNAFMQLENNLTKLTNINLESCLVSDIAILSIKNNCQNLEAIDLSWCKNITSSALGNLVESSSKLKYLSSKGLANMNDDVLKKISTNCTNLTHFNINNCDNITDEGLIPIANNCNSIKFLGVSNCSHLTDASLFSLGRNCNDLKILEASCCSNMTDNGFIMMSKGCPRLERIDLEECIRITDSTIIQLSVNCFNLRHLTLSRCESITDESIRQLSLSNCVTVNETLQVLELDNCPLITDDSLEHLYGCKSLVQLELYDCQLISRSGIKKLQKTLPNCKVHAYFAPQMTALGQRPNRSCSCKCCTVL